MDVFFSHKDAYAVLAFLVLGLCAAGPIVAFYWFKTRRVEMELALKQSMIERGMTAEEICAVMNAGVNSRPEPIEPEMRTTAGIHNRA
jgi:hypothetical protein